VILTGFVGLWHIASSSAQKQEPTSQGKWKVKNTGPKDPRAEANPMTAAEASAYTIENQIPAHLPLKVELLNLDKEPLLANIEVKVTNTSKKPIYFLELAITLPDFSLPQGAPLGYVFQYGRSDLATFKEPANSEDKPINPNESYVFKVTGEMLSIFEEQMTQINHTQSEVRRVYLFFAQLNFGDKTGFLSNAGTPIPNVTSTGPAKCRDGTKAGTQSDSQSPKDICCPGTPCSKLVAGRFNCQCPDPINPNRTYAGFTTHTTSCSDELPSLLTAIVRQPLCWNRLATCVAC
jgi:hypothetical protein